MDSWSEFTDPPFVKHFSGDQIHKFLPKLFLDKFPKSFLDHSSKSFLGSESRDSRLSIVHHYFSNLEDLTTSVPISSARELDSLEQMHKVKNVIFKVPEFAEIQYRIKKYQLVEVYISFLVLLLYHKRDDSIIGLCKDGIEHLEKELRFLHTILGDTPFMMCADEHQEFQNLLGENSSSLMNILELSYKHLPDHLKPCFLYFGAFEKDREIRVSQMTRLWIAEGFIREEAGKSAENIAEEYLTNLIDKSLVIVAKTRSDGGVKACVVHDLVHDLCLQKCEDENFMNFVKTNDRYTMQGKGHRLQYPVIHDVPWIHNQHLHSFRGDSLLCNTISFYIRDLRLLRVLHFDHIFNHYIGIEYLFSLRYLVVRDLPPSIGSLVNLEYLRVDPSGMVILPPELLKMKKLRYIHVYDPHLGAYVAYGGDWDVSQTNSLEFLSAAVITELKDEEMLRCLPHLRKLKCIYQEAFVSMIQATRHVDMRFFTQLVSLNVELRGFVMLEKISFPRSIKKLTLSGMFIRLWEEMSTIGRLENLEVLKLRRVRTMGGNNWHTSDAEFQKLKFLEMDSTIIRWNVASSQHFPRLQRLLLRNCYNMKEIPSEIGEITTLQLIEVRGKCRKSVVESARRIQQEQFDMGNDELRILVSQD